jgi:hypothetical protein
MHQAKEQRFVLHLFHAAPLYRGGSMELAGGTTSGCSSGLEVVEDLLPLHDIQLELQVKRKVMSVTLAPQGDAVSFVQEGSRVQFEIDRFICHQMVVLQYCI